MNEKYIVSFEAGTSGRFVCSIIWNLINDFDFEYNFTDTNSAHLRGPWIETVELIDDENKLKLQPSLVNHPDIYNRVKFTDKNSTRYNPYTSGLLQTHTYPDFVSIRNNFPDAKVVLITFDEDDVLEIIINTLYKNFFDSAIIEGWLIPFRTTGNLLLDKLIKMHEIYSVTGKLPDQQFMKPICIEYAKIFISHPMFEVSTSKFSSENNQNITDTQTLILNYKELFTIENDQYVGLNKILEFTNKILTRNTLASYKKYVDGRNNFITNIVPDIEDIRYHVKINNKNSTYIWPNMYSYCEPHFTIHRNYHSNDYRSPLIVGNVWPYVDVRFYQANHMIGYDQNSRYDMKYMKVSMWPNTNYYNPMYSLGYSPDEWLENTTYNFDFHVYNTIWPNILRNDNNPNLLLGTNPSDPTYDYLYHTYNNIWPIIQGNVDKPNLYLGTSNPPAHNKELKGNEYIIANITNSFDDVLIPTLWSIENLLFVDFSILNQVYPWLRTIDSSTIQNRNYKNVYRDFVFEYHNYEKFNFNYLGLLQTEIFPDFNVIAERYPKAKIIIISLETDDLLEIVTHSIYDKWLDVNKLYPFQKMQFKTAYKELYNKEFESGDKLDKQFLDFLIKKVYNSLMDRSYFDPYINPVVPEEHKERTLVIRYKDFYAKNDQTYIGLDKLCSFIGQEADEVIIDKYISAVEKRKLFISTHLPNYED